MTKTQKKSKTNWHHRFGKLLQLLLESVGIDVKIDAKLFYLETFIYSAR